jgi:hypothetical protein
MTTETTSVASVTSSAACPVRSETMIFHVAFGTAIRCPIFRRVQIENGTRHDVDLGIRSLGKLAFVIFDLLPWAGIQLVNLRDHVRHQKRDRVHLFGRISIRRGAHVTSVIVRVEIVMRGDVVDVHRQGRIGTKVILPVDVTEVRAVELPGNPVRIEPLRIVRDDVLVLVQEDVVRGVCVGGHAEGQVRARCERSGRSCRRPVRKSPDRERPDRRIVNTQIGAS